ncbi:hypothetical protein [Leifsonia soli]|uniref:Uncharacterized protein n=1 Tax=Leifsonia soli TaxID=582665 RepID=A0A852T5M8_9MICO|nr:hypothetical protein [Leifsonia soli]NYD76125.1 hypothetical protein [Leifsonia soli]
MTSKADPLGDAKTLVADYKRARSDYLTGLWYQMLLVCALVAVLATGVWVVGHLPEARLELAVTGEQSLLALTVLAAIALALQVVVRNSTDSMPDLARSRVLEFASVIVGSASFGVAALSTWHEAMKSPQSVFGVLCPALVGAAVVLVAADASARTRTDLAAAQDLVARVHLNKWLRSRGGRARLGSRRLLPFELCAVVLLGGCAAVIAIEAWATGKADASNLAAAGYLGAVGLCLATSAFAMWVTGSRLFVVPGLAYILVVLLVGWVVAGGTNSHELLGLVPLAVTIVVLAPIASLRHVLGWWYRNELRRTDEALAKAGLAGDAQFE